MSTPLLRRTFWPALVVLCCLTAARAEAAPITVNLWTAGTDGILDDGFNNPVTYIDPLTGLKADAFYLTATGWQQTFLFARDESPDDLGLGVCSPNETCGAGDGGGDWNELSSLTNSEIIRLTLPAGYTWSSVGLSSLDTNGNTVPERGQLWASNSSLPGTTPGSLFAGLPLWQFQGGVDGINATSPLASSTPQYLFFEAYDWTAGHANLNNDYLVRVAVLDDTSTTTFGSPVPEPATLSLLTGGLLAMAARRRAQNKKNKA